jgi:hypothetical protein
VIALRTVTPCTSPFIDLPTLLGLADHPGEIPGYGIIPAGLARQLAADGTWRRLVTDPQTGHLIVPSVRSDIDHATAYPDGGTDRDNLGPFDRRAHRVKTKRDWKARRTPDGTTHWASPTGHTYQNRPHDYRLGP